LNHPNDAAMPGFLQRTNEGRWPNFPVRAMQANHCLLQGIRQAASHTYRVLSVNKLCRFRRQACVLSNPSYLDRARVDHAQNHSCSPHRAASSFLNAEGNRSNATSETSEVGLELIPIGWLVYTTIRCGTVVLREAVKRVQRGTRSTSIWYNYNTVTPVLDAYKDDGSRLDHGIRRCRQEAILDGSTKGPR